MHTAGRTLLCVVAVLLLVLVFIVAAAWRRAGPARVVRGGRPAPGPASKRFRDTVDAGWWDARPGPATRRLALRFARSAAGAFAREHRGFDAAAFGRALGAAARSTGRARRRALAAAAALAAPFGARAAGAIAADQRDARAARRAGAIAAALARAGAGPPAGPFLDVGCGDGSVTRAVARALPAGAPAPAVVCLEKAETPKAAGAGVAYAADLAGAPARHFGLVTAVMSLHHLGPALDGTLREVARATRPGGLFVVREHDLPRGRRALREYVGWVHAVFAALEGSDIDEAVRADYRAAAEWTAALEAHGFEALGAAQPQGDLARSYYAVYRKK